MSGFQLRGSVARVPIFVCVCLAREFLSSTADVLATFKPTARVSRVLATCWYKKYSHVACELHFVFSNAPAENIPPSTLTAMPRMSALSERRLSREKCPEEGISWSTPAADASVSLTAHLRYIEEACA